MKKDKKKKKGSNFFAIFILIIASAGVIASVTLLTRSLKESTASTNGSVVVTETIQATLPTSIETSEDHLVI